LQSAQKKSSSLQSAGKKKTTRKSKKVGLKFGRNKKALTFATPNDKRVRKTRAGRGIKN
jgi:hypothetical protein